MQLKYLLSQMRKVNTSYSFGAANEWDIEYE